MSLIQKNELAFDLQPRRRLFQKFDFPFRKLRAAEVDVGQLAAADALVLAFDQRSDVSQGRVRDPGAAEIQLLQPAEMLQRG